MRSRPRRRASGPVPAGGRALPEGVGRLHRARRRRRPGLAAAGPLPEEAVRSLAARLAHALADVHRAGLIHPDLKPSHVLCAQDGGRVIDFGIPPAGVLIGSPAYTSPEQVLGQEPAPAGDVFALGATLVAGCAGCAGSPPFAAERCPARCTRRSSPTPIWTAYRPDCAGSSRPAGRRRGPFPPAGLRGAAAPVRATAAPRAAGARPGRAARPGAAPGLRCPGRRPGGCGPCRPPASWWPWPRRGPP
ncbi:phosphotransferase [Streptomyces sp. NPDC058646]|uniref:protein kinase domain-containing protein n=1 Tax=Streptomyces sp. NPDC058646 TaxID=3346574 RepID=UPI00365AB82F